MHESLYFYLARVQLWYCFLFMHVNNFLTCYICFTKHVNVNYKVDFGSYFSAWGISKSSSTLWSSKKRDGLSYELHTMPLCKDILLAWKPNSYIFYSGIPKLLSSSIQLSRLIWWYSLGQNWFLGIKKMNI